MAHNFNNRRTNEELRALFNQKGLSWVREQLETSGGQINILEAPFAKIWVEDEKEKRKKRGKIEERVWNLVFLLIGAFISGFVAYQITNKQLSIAVDPVVEIAPYDTVIGKKGNFELSIRNEGIADIYKIDIYEDYFATDSSDGTMRLVTIAPWLTLPKEKFENLEKNTEKKFILDAKPALEEMDKFYNKRGGLHMQFVRLLVEYRRKPDGKKFKDTKVYIIDLGGSNLSDYQERGVSNPYTLSFDGVKKTLGVEEW